MLPRNSIIQHDARTRWPLPDNSVDVIVTSPPYWGLRDYKHTDQIGQERTPEEFIQTMVHVFTEGNRVLKEGGSLWLNLADTYWGGKGQSGGAWQGDHLNGDGQNFTQKGQTRPQDRRHPFIKPKDLVGIPWEVALALRNAGWYLRQDIIWNKPNPLPESMNDRCSKSHEYLFFLTKGRNYFFDQVAIMQPVKDVSAVRLSQDLGAQNGSQRTPGKTNGTMKAVPGKVEGMANKKSVWTVATKGFDGEFCTACRRYYEGRTRGLIRTETVIEKGKEVKRNYCQCGRHDAWVAHFATFPEELIIDCIKASTSQEGNCATCGAPWERVTESAFDVDTDGDTNSRYEKGSTANRLAMKRQAAREQGLEYSSTRRTVGWKPTCACAREEKVRPVVVDPFMGGATTAMVALSLGCDFIGLELNQDYIDLATNRIRHAYPLFSPL